MKRVSYKAVRALSVLMMTVVFVLIYHTATKRSHRQHDKAKSATAKIVKKHELYRRQGKVVILYSNQRSGSTFVGDFFNKNPDAFYLFEPLFSYTPSCSVLYEERLKTLKNISICDLRALPDDYHRAHSVNHYIDRAGKCLTDNICFIGNHPFLSKKYAALCSAIAYGNLSNEALSKVESTIREYRTTHKLRQRHETCRTPLNMTLVSALCTSSYLVAYKVLRVCDLSKLERVYRELTDMGNEVYAIHLVRDPRAIINSCQKTELPPAGLKNTTIMLCKRLERNIKYAQDQESGKNIVVGGMISEGRYMRVRHEDISSDPMQSAEEIYQFAGLPLPPKVREWIKESSIDPASAIQRLKEKLAKEKLTYQERQDTFAKVKELVAKKNDPYGTVRDSKSVPGRWRKSMRIEHVSMIQEHCEEA